MSRTNETLKWITEDMSNKIRIEEGILNGDKNRGVYGIFIINIDNGKEFCAYVGRAVNIYARFFCGKDAHLVKLRRGMLHNLKIENVLQNQNEMIEVRVLKEV